MKVIFVSENSERSDLDLKRGDPEELVMMIDADRCISCGSCELACQLEHGGSVRSPASYRPIRTDSEKGKGGRRTIRLPLTCRHCDSPCEYYSQYNFWTFCPKAEKEIEIEACDFCLDRTKKGLWPACATSCTMKAIYFGRAEDMAFTLREKRVSGMGDVTISWE